VTIPQPAVLPPPPPAVIDTQGWRETDQRVSGRERGVAARAALNGGVIAALLSLLPFGFLIGMPLGGFLAVLFYRRRSWRAEPSSHGGFQLGALAGLIGFILLVVFIVSMVLVSKGEDQVRQQALEVLRWANARSRDPEQQKVYEYFSSPQGLTIFLELSVIMSGVIAVLLSGIGGVLSAFLLSRKGPRS
jgi:MFS family permease